MLCDKCKTKEAVFHYKVSSNGKVSETHLCSECASAAGISTDSFFGGHQNIFSHTASEDDVFGSFFGGLLHSPSAYQKKLVCPSCGMTRSELASTGKLGCAVCCKTFYNMLQPTVAKIHGNVMHTGKAPKGFSAQAEKKNEIASLKAKLAAAIETQEYEQAAKLRDKIRELEGTENGGGDNK